jgi:hypothetical protein
MYDCDGCEAEHDRAIQSSKNDDEYIMFDKLAGILGIAGLNSHEENNLSTVYRRKVLRAAIKELKLSRSE